MHKTILSLLIPLSFIFSSCNSKKKSDDSSSIRQLPIEQQSYYIGSQGRVYEGDKIPSKNDFLEALNKDIDTRAKDNTKIEVIMRFSGLGNELYQMVSLQKEADTFILKKYERPFKEPITLGEFPNIEPAILKLKAAVKKTYEINENITDQLKSANKSQ